MQLTCTGISTQPYYPFNGKLSLVRKVSHPSFCRKCGTPLKSESQFCPKCGKEVTTILPPMTGTQPQPYPQAPAYSYNPPQQKHWIRGVDNRLLILAVVIFLLLVLPIFPRTRTVYVDGTTQSMTNVTSYSTSYQVVSQPTQQQITVYTGSFQYFTNNYYYYGYNPWWNQGCYWYYHHIVCNYSSWYWYQPNYGTTVTVTPDQNVVNVIRTQQGSSESLTLVYYNGQQSQTYNNVYVDNLQPTGQSTIQTTTVVTNPVVTPIVTPQSVTVPCTQCVPTQVTDHVSILQLIFGF